MSQRSRIGGFAWNGESPAKPLPTSWLTEVMGRAELMPELVVPGELSQARSRVMFMELNMSYLQAKV